MRPWIIPALFLLISSCGGQAEDAQSRTEVMDVVQLYVNRLPLVYESGNPDLLSEYATIKEREAIRKLIHALMIRGYRISAVLQEYKVTYVDVFNGTSAYVRTIERWNVATLTAKTCAELSRDEGQTLHVVYQWQKFSPEGWRVTARRVAATKKQR